MRTWTFSVKAKTDINSMALDKDTAQQGETMDSPLTFLTLPLEIRLEIYDLLLASESNGEVTIGGNVPRDSHSPMRLKSLIKSGKSEVFINENIAGVPKKQKEKRQEQASPSRDAQRDGDDSNWSPFCILEVCPQIEVEVSRHLRKRWMSRWRPVRGLHVTYPYGVAALNGPYSGLISIVEEIHITGVHQLEHPLTEESPKKIFETQKVAMEGLTRCIRGMGTSSLRKLTLRTYHASGLREGTSSTSDTDPVMKLLGASIGKSLEFDVKEWKGEGGDSGFVVVIQKQSDSQQNDMMRRRIRWDWPSWWDGEDWIALLKGEGREFGGEITWKKEGVDSGTLMAV
jgi:hypothetical protein